MTVFRRRGDGEPLLGFRDLIVDRGDIAYQVHAILEVLSDDEAREFAEALSSDRLLAKVKESKNG